MLRGEKSNLVRFLGDLRRPLVASEYLNIPSSYIQETYYSLFDPLEPEGFFKTIAGIAELVFLRLPIITSLIYLVLCRLI